MSDKELYLSPDDLERLKFAMASLQEAEMLWKASNIAYQQESRYLSNKYNLGEDDYVLDPNTGAITKKEDAAVPEENSDR